MDETRTIDSDFEYSIFTKFQSYRNKSVDSLARDFGIESNSKNLLEFICAKILNLKGRPNANSDFLKRNIVLKTIRIENNGSIKESMSFPSFKFTELVNEAWSDSTLRNIFSKTRFLFVVFKKENDLVLEKIMFWSMPISVLDDKVKEVFEKTKDVLVEGNIVSDIKELSNGKFNVKTNFPGMNFNGVCHVRPHARNAEDVYQLPVIDKMTGMKAFTKQCFWLNSSFIKKVVS